MSTKSANSKERRVTEAVGFAGEVDEEAGVIRDVLLGGYDSKNGYDYTHEAYDDAIATGVYDGVDVYIDHSCFEGDGLSQPEPSVKEAWGCVENPRHVPGQGIRGDVHYLKSDSFTPKVLERIRRWPSRCGFSHDANCKFENSADGVRVTKVRKVYRVDLVRQPATTRGVWESVRNKPMQNERTREMEEGALDMVDDALAPDAAMDDATGGATIEGAVAALEAALSQAVAAIVADTTIDAAEMKKRIGTVVVKLRDLMDTLTGEGGGDEPASDEAPAEEEAPAQESVRLKEQVQRLESDVATLRSRIKKISAGSLSGVLYRGVQESQRPAASAQTVPNSRRVFTMHDED